MKIPPTFGLFALIAVLSASILSCASQDALDPFAGEPEAKIEKMEIESISFRDIDLLFTVSIHNPYPVGISLAGFDYDFLLDGSSFVSGRRDEGMEIAAKGNSAVHIPVTFTFEELRDTMKKVKGKNEVPYRLDLGLEVQLPLSRGKMRLSKSNDGMLPLPKLPQVGIQDVIITKFGLSRIFLEFGIKVTNPNTLGLSLGSLDFSFFVEGEKWLSGETGRSYRIGEGDEKIIYIPLELNYMKVGRAVVDLLMSGRVLRYRIEGSSAVSIGKPGLNSKSRPFAFATEGQAAIIRP
jgi:LEA14-like dessication related protein